MDESGTIWHTYKSAARRVKRSPRNIRRWHAEGMVMSWRVGTDGHRERVVREDVLLAWWRDRMIASPVHYYRRRAAARADGRPDPERPPSTYRQNLPVAAPPDEPEAGVDLFTPAVTTAELLETLQLKRGADEYDALTAALKTTETPCAYDERFTADWLSDFPSELDAMAAMCAECPLASLCDAFARAADPAGFWAGQLRRQAHTVAT
jgi:hypothetical protein